MQIVRDLAGYSYGRSDLVRRAMSKKKTSVMEQERKNFVYGNEQENVSGCIANGIEEKVANHIFDEMVDFAKYAFNKSHAAAYAVIAYQTAYLKCYYRLEYMAALLTSVMNFNHKVSEYIQGCRSMGIEILPPDINAGEGNFSVTNGAIRYGLSAIKGVGEPIIEAIVKERNQGGFFVSLQDFIRRLSGKDINKRILEGFIKSGAMDTLPGTRKQKMMIYSQIMDSTAQEKKNLVTGQISLFDIISEEERTELEISMPDVGEYEKEEYLSYEKEMLGVYVSGHPLEEYENLLNKNITATTADFLIEEETGETEVKDGDTVWVGGMVTAKKIKMTQKNNNVMAFITLEDILGSLEVIIFPKIYEKYKKYLSNESKIFIKGRVNAEEEKNAKLIAQKVIAFEEIPRELWIQFTNKTEFQEKQEILYGFLAESDGIDTVCIFCQEEKVIKRFPKNRSVKINVDLIKKLESVFSAKNVKIVEKSIDNKEEMN